MAETINCLQATTPYYETAISGNDETRKHIRSVKKFVSKVSKQKDFERQECTQ